MSLKKIFASVAHAVGLGTAAASATLSTTALTSVHQLGKSLAGSIAAVGEQSNPVGAAIAAGIKAADDAAAADPSLTSPGKLKVAVGIAAPAIIAEAAKVGVTGIEAEAERWAEMAIENALSLLKMTPLARLGMALLHDIGVNV